MSETNPMDFGNLDDAYQETKVPENKGYTLLPTGTYKMTIVGCKPDYKEEWNARFIEWTLVVDGPRHKGKKRRKRSVIEADKLKWLKKDLLALDLELKGGSLNAFNDEEWVNENIVGLQVEVYCSHGTSKKDATKKFERLYFNKRVGRRDITEDDHMEDDETSEIEGSGGYSEDDDRPF